jgi:predicted FMN-binding regulatory protein PaiB
MKVSMKEHESIEKKETPEFEAKEHPTSFLKKAEKMSREHKIKAEKMGGKHKVEKAEKKSPRKR